MHLVGDFGDDDVPGAVLGLFHLPFGADAKAAAAGGIGLADAFGGFDQGAAGGEIGAFDMGEEFVDFGLGVGDEGQSCAAELARIVRRDGGGHAHGNACRAIGEQVGEGGGQDDGLALLAIISGAEIDGVAVDIGQHGFGDEGEAGLGVAHGGGVIAVDVSEVSLAFDEGVAGGEILGEADHGVINRRIAMRVIFAHHIAHDAGAFLEAAGRVQLQLVHGPEHAAMDGLQPIAHIGQRAGGDGGHGIGEVALGEGISERGVAHMAAGGRGGSHIIWHGYSGFVLAGRLLHHAPASRQSGA